MNGRVYDPLLGRFLSADPFVQAPTNTQSPNRYTYVFNNPLSYTDPSGYFAIAGHKVGGFFGKTVDSFGKMFAKFDKTMRTDRSSEMQLLRTGMVVAACIYGGAPGCAAASGAMTYWMTTDLQQSAKAAAIAYVSAHVAGKIGGAAEAGTITSTQAAVLHGISQGTIAVVGAGQFSWRAFGAGFVSGSVGHAMGQYVDNKFIDIFLAGSLGGVTSRIAGGSFSDGFKTAAMVRIFNHWEHIKIKMLDFVEAATKYNMGFWDSMTMGGTSSIRIAAGSDESFTGDFAYEAGALTGDVASMGNPAGIVKNGVKFSAKGLKNLFGKKCFTAGTPVLTRRGLIPIENIKQGDMVAARNDETGHTDWKPVKQLFQNENKTVLNITFNGGAVSSEVIQVTPDHPFHVAQVGWVNADQLEIGDQISTHDGTQRWVQAIATDAKLHTTYNFEVADYHSYFVGESKLWVHNSCDADSLSILTTEVNPKELIGRQSKNEMSSNKIKRLRRTMRESGYDPQYPIDVAEVNGKLIILDGHHRAQGAIGAGLRTVPVNVKRNVTGKEADNLLIEVAESRLNM